MTEIATQSEQLIEQSTIEGHIPELSSVNSLEFSCEDMEKLKNKILEELQKSGFILKEDKLEFEGDKNQIRLLHQSAVDEMRKKYLKQLKPNEPELIKNIANGDEVVPENIKPVLEYVDSNMENWDLFNYIKIHWSIPVSAGYGRRLCFIVRDKNNNKVIGIIGLCDPVFLIPTRDKFIGWGKDEREINIRKVLDAFVLGAVPPYNLILGGKLVASMLFSNEIRNAYKLKYKGKKSLISGKKHSGDLVLITTLSALGKSAIYDRIKIPTGQRYVSCGNSFGWGEFHFNGSTYSEMKKMVSLYKPASIKAEKWGTGFRNKREVVDKSLRLLDIPRTYMRHGIEREQFIIPLASNYKEVLKSNEIPSYYDISVNEIASFIKKRWVIPRAERDPSYREFKRETYKLWE